MKSQHIAAALLTAAAFTGTAHADRKDDANPNSPFHYVDISPSGYSGKLDKASDSLIQSVADADAEAMWKDPLWAKDWSKQYDWEHPATGVLYDEICAIAAGYGLAADGVPDEVSHRWEVYIDEIEAALKAIHENSLQPTK
jgi:hypothetical protein